MPLRHFLKFLHSLGAAGFLGGLAALLVIVMLLTPAGINTAGYVQLRAAMAKIAAWVIGPSMLLTVMAGLAAIAINPGFHEAGWAWAKAATGILILEGYLHVMGPIGEEAKHATSAPPSSGLASLLSAEANTLWVLLAVSIANIALAIWRPRMPKIPV